MRGVMFPVHVGGERAAMLIASLYWHSWQPSQHPHWKAIHQPAALHCSRNPTAELAPLGLLRCDRHPLAQHPWGGPVCLLPARLLGVVEPCLIDCFTLWGLVLGKPQAGVLGIS